ncbi:MAG: hypothetical protein K2P92_01385, partial [Bdellovibrionaceae bacterium]|nr:hypothetical protein [Pseudobdellovibrionaceae bacterium]
RGRTFSILFQRGFMTDSSTAEASFLEFHRLAPRNPGPYFENAMLDLRNRKTDGFIEKMQTVISLKADFLPAHVELIKYYIKTNDGEKIDPLVARILTTDFRSAEFLPEIKAVAALCQNNGKQNLADQLENLYEQKKYLLMKTY